jgi:hypothetical protein
MSALRYAIADAEHGSRDEGNPYTIHIVTRSGQEIHGAVVKVDGLVVILQVWEKVTCMSPSAGPSEHFQATDRKVYVEADAVETAEVIW